MEPMLMALAWSALGHVGDALFHTAVHLAGHETLHSLKVRLSKQSLANHDINHALKDSLIAGLGLVERKFMDNVGASKASDAKVVFRRLRAVALGANVSQRATSEGHAYEAPAALDDKDMLVRELLARSGRIPPDIAQVLRTELPAAVSLAFMEIGIKRNSVVRAAVTHGLLEELKRSARASEAMLADVKTALEDPKVLEQRHEDLIAFQVSFQATTEQSFAAVLDELDEAREQRQELMRMLEAKLVGHGPLVGFVIVCDADGVAVLSQGVHLRTLSIGRDLDNDVPLPHKAVSRKHAILHIQDDVVIVEDRSRNGTKVDGVRVTQKMTTCAFGAKISIGPFEVTVFRPDAASQLPPVVGTVPMPDEPSAMESES